MKNISIGVFFLFGMLQTQAQETKTLWQKDIPSSTQDFLTTSSSTIDSKSCFQETLLIQNLNRFQQAISNPIKVTIIILLNWINREINCGINISAELDMIT